MLVITELNWGYQTAQPDHMYCLVLSVGTTDPPIGLTPYLHQSCLNTDSDGFGNVSDTLTTGFVVRENQKLYTAGPWDPLNGGPADGSGDYLARPDGSAVVVRGYLVDEGGGRRGRR